MLNTRPLRALALALTLIVSPASAEQASTVLPITGPHTMAEYSGLLNDALFAILSCGSGSSAPANGVGAAATHYQCWADTTSNPTVVKMYDGASWVVVGKLNTSSHIWTPSYQGTDLGTASIATMGTAGHAVPFLDGTNTWSAVQMFNSGTVVLKGATSGQATLNAPAVAGSAVITLPGVTGTVATLSGTETLSNKTLTAPAIGSATGISLALGGAAIGGNVLAVAGTSALTSTSAAAFSVGANGATNPAFQVDASASSQTTGVKIQGQAAGGGPQISTTSPNTDENINLNGKGAGIVRIGSVSTGGVSLGSAGGGVTISSALTYGGVTLSNSVTGSGSMVLSTSPQLSALGVGTAAPSAGNLNITGQYQIGGSPIAASNLAAIAAYSFIGNTGAASAAPAAFTIGGLTNKATPASTDVLLLQDQAAGGALKFCTIAQCVSATASGVSSFNSRTGAVVPTAGDYTGGMINFTAGGTGSVTTTVGTKLNSMVWIGDFGAVCDGVTNDTTAIQNAWNKAATIGANVWLGGIGPTCVISSLTMPTPQIVSNVGNFGQSRAAMLVGPGATELTLLSTVTGTSCAVTISATYGTNSYLAGVFQGVGLKQSTNAKAGYGWCLRGITKAQFRDISASQFLRGVDATDAILVTISESNFSQNTNHIVAQKGTISEPNGWSILTTHFETSANYGIYLLAGQQNNIRFNDFESNGSAGASARSIYVSQLNQGANLLANIDGNYFEGNQGYELEIDQSSFNVKAIVNFTSNTLGKNNAGQLGGILATNTGSAAAHTTVNLAGNSFLDALASGMIWFQTSTGTANVLWNCGGQWVNEFSPTTNVNATCLVSATGFR